MIKKNNKNPKRSLFYYYGVALLIIFALNFLVLPMFTTPETESVPYNEFVDMIANGEVSQVEIQNEKNQIVFLTKEDGKETPKKPSLFDKPQKVYVTSSVGDPDLVQRLLDSKVKFSAIWPEPPSLLWTTIVPIAAMLLLGWLLTRSMQKKMAGNVMSFGKSNAKVYVEAQTGKTFADVAGQDEAKEALTEIVDFLHNPDKYASIGAKLPKGALLVGPPGTGKTLLAKAVAGEAHVPFFSISGSEFVEMFVGMGAAKVRDLFKQANEKAPCIVFIDEIDTIGKKRETGGMGGNDEREQTLNQLLAEMDGFDGRKGVVILAATNRPESLDPALLRPGRFDRRIPVELPDLKGREAILKVHAKAVIMQQPIDFNAIACATAGASGAELENIINEAALRAVRLGRSALNQSDLEESVETVIAGAQRKNAVISQKEKEIVAYHEIGHALVAAKQSDSAPVHKITIIPRTSGALGYTMQVEEGEHMLMSRDEAFNKIATFTGGRAAEELIFGSVTTGAANDIEQATKLARAMVTRYGMSREFDMVALETVQNAYLGGDASLTCSAETAAQIDREVVSLVKEAHTKAVSILKENLDLLHKLSHHLLEQETITGEQFMAILREG
ncbi:ATP-dependent zinc metalloprotease FtsH [Intestinibacillus massiliensis]|uniref:ATP-dependent zinc metalloprotease FtsH n=1 Tax=Intestinibacillus massiliensis TaxID=1871029 RepID=UPI000B351359|nr:ATP-dependent zinc metalloprotease FtsH [Intestinibacillus massiliensis]